MNSSRATSLLSGPLASARQAMRVSRHRCAAAQPPAAPVRRMTTQKFPNPNPQNGAAPPRQLRDKSIVGPFTWRAGALFVVTGTALYYYFEQEKAKIKQKKREESATTSIGRPNIGGSFRLATHHNPSRTFTEADLLGHWNLLYFGFTNCPDICPEELDKMGVVVDETDKMTGKQLVQPIFISCDPARDTIEQVRAYMSDFHPRMIGLTGTYEAVKQACKSYRVYFSTPPDAKPTEDYLVDHSIFFYLMDPDGKFVDAFGKNSTAEDVTKKLMEAVGRYESR